MKDHNQHFVERLIARTIGKGFDIAINPAIMPDMLPGIFHLPEQQFIIPFSSSSLMHHQHQSMQNRNPL